MSKIFSRVFRHLLKPPVGRHPSVRVVAKRKDSIFHSRGVLFPREKTAFVFRNVDPGNYEFAIEHTDDVLHRLRREMVFQILVGGKKLSKTDAKLFGASFDQQHGAVINLDFGKFHSGKILHRRSLRVPHSVEVLEIVVHMNANRIANIDHLSLFPEGENKEYPLGLLYAKSTKANRDRIKRLERKISHLEHALESSASAGAAENGLGSVMSTQRLSALLCDAAAKGQRIFVVHSGIDLNVIDGSSVWISNIVNILSENDFVLVLAPYIVKTDLITSQFAYPDNCQVISTDTVRPDLDHYKSYGRKGIDLDEWTEFLKILDAVTPAPLYFVVRGYEVASSMLRDRYFYRRCMLYLTDFYTVEDGERIVRKDAPDLLHSMSRQSAGMLYQTEAIRDMLISLSVAERNLVECSPALPNLWRGEAKAPGAEISAKIPHIVYAGKISPNWGVEELLRFAIEMRSRSRPIRITLIANKISSNSKIVSSEEYREMISRLAEAAGAELLRHIARDAVRNYLLAADFVWCYRPAALEENTLELSTKLLEAVALGCRAICYSNSINRNLLGEDYPYFAAKPEDFYRLVSERSEPISSELVKRVNERFSRKKVASVLLSSAPFSNCRPLRTDLPTICFSGHDFKFIDPYVNGLERLGYPVLRDIWEWGGKNVLGEAFEMARRADIIFCEWGLANAVWHSRNNNVKKPLFIRVHLQEINEKAEKFGHQIEINNVTKIIFVSERVKNAAMAMFGWPESKLEVVPNFVLDDEFDFFDDGRPRVGQQLTLGMVGIVPSRKRFDRAIDTISGLRSLGHDARLVIKGPRPEELEFMRALGRAHELEYYQMQYDRIDRAALQEHIEFVPWGNDMCSWYRDIDVILSPSDFESFHYAVADGVLCGCYPVLWPWDEAASIYSPDWIVSDVEGAVESIAAFDMQSDAWKRRTLRANRELVVERYGHRKVYTMLKQSMNLPADSCSVH